MTLGVAVGLFFLGVVLCLLFAGVLNTIGVILIVAGVLGTLYVLVAGSSRRVR